MIRNFKYTSWFIIALGLVFALMALWPKNKALHHDFSIADEDSPIVIDHQPWDTLLKKYIDESDGKISKFDYKNVSEQDKSNLKTYIATLTKVQVDKLNSVEQMAYWINLYNALTIQIVLNAYPIDTIKKIDSPLFKTGPWSKKRVQVEGEPLSLDDIEHQILRPVYQDPRVHYGVNCASLGCPNLQSQAYTAENLEELLDLGAEQYINHPRGLSVINGKLHASSIYKWFASDFGGEQDLLDHFLDYANDELAQQLQQHTRISDYHYDWLINEKS